MLEKVNPSSLETAGVAKAVNHVEANAKRPSSFISINIQKSRKREKTYDKNSEIVSEQKK